jgi:hypothetical protein
MFGQAPGDPVLEAHFLFLHAGMDSVIMFLAAILFSTPLYPWLMGRTVNVAGTGLMSSAVRATWYAMLMGAMIISFAYIAAGTYNPFIYFRF